MIRCNFDPIEIGIFALHQHIFRLKFILYKIVFQYQNNARNRPEYVRLCAFENSKLQCQFCKSCAIFGDDLKSCPKQSIHTSRTQIFQNDSRSFRIVQLSGAINDSLYLQFTERYLNKINNINWQRS